MTRYEIAEVRKIVRRQVVLAYRKGKAEGFDRGFEVCGWIDDSKCEVIS